MTYPFRNFSPKRTCSEHFNNFRKYKKFLAEDFNHKCGYTNCSDFRFGGKTTFQIDHFKPQKKYPYLKNTYSNLVYCCSFVNRAKWDDDSPNYLDPCDVDYNEHFERDNEGCIKAKTKQAQYMIDHMNLNLQRYSICWKLDRLSEEIEKLEKIKVSPEIDKIKLTIYKEYMKYENYLKEEL